MFERNAAPRTADQPDTAPTNRPLPQRHRRSGGPLPLACVRGRGSLSEISWKRDHIELPAGNVTGELVHLQAHRFVHEPGEPAARDDASDLMGDELKGARPSSRAFGGDGTALGMRAHALGTPHHAHAASHRAWPTSGLMPTTHRHLVAVGDPTD
jgi:hypothetical protein